MKIEEVFHVELAEDEIEMNGIFKDETDRSH